jgi:hypothetical protein
VLLLQSSGTLACQSFDGTDSIQTTSSLKPLSRFPIPPCVCTLRDHRVLSASLDPIEATRRVVCASHQSSRLQCCNISIYYIYFLNHHRITSAAGASDLLRHGYSGFFLFVNHLKQLNKNMGAQTFQQVRFLGPQAPLTRMTYARRVYDRYDMPPGRASRRTSAEFRSGSLLSPQAS